MTQPDDQRLERELRDALDRRDPGPAPLALRERVLRVPDTAPARPSAARQAVSLVLGLAAMVTLAVLLASVLSRWGPVTGGPVPSQPGASVAAAASAAIASVGPSGASPSLSPAPGVTFQLGTIGAGPNFDPYAIGPGIVAHADDGSWLRLLVGLCAALLVVLAASLSRRQRIVPVVLAVGLVGWVAVGSLVPVDVRASGWGPGISTVNGPRPFGYSESVIYAVAEPGRPFTILLKDLGGFAMLPVRLEGVESGTASQELADDTAWTAVWLDRASSGFSSDPGEPFTVLALPSDRSLWLVGRGSLCAFGPTFDPARSPSQANQFSSRDTVVFQASVLGVPRRIEVRLGFVLVEPEITCTSPPADGNWPPTAPPSTAPSTSPTGSSAP